MSQETIKEIIVKAINSSNYQLNSLENKPNGVMVEVAKQSKYGYTNSVRGLIKNEVDIGNFKEVLGLN
jgi:hypothetical protein